jgi:putative oxidoreductase
MKNLKMLKFILSLVIGIMFVYSSWSKLISPRDFASTIENYKVFGFVLANWGAIFIPVLEFTLGVLLIIGFWREEAWFITLFLIVIFDVMILQAYFRGLDISCGCFGSNESSLIDLGKILENVIYTLVVAVGGYLHLKKTMPSRS